MWCWSLENNVGHCAKIGTDEAFDGSMKPARNHAFGSHVLTTTYGLYCWQIYKLRGRFGENVGGS
jgi:hypothetical protein